MYIINAITFDFARVDSSAITIFIIGFGVVFTALTIIYFCFLLIPKLLKVNLKKKEVENSEVKNEIITNDSDSEIIAAIAMALSLHFEDIHDEESMILTINLNDRLNSQWSSKIQNIEIYKN
ncbi:MAG: OadG family protein [Bacteroidales bacterium]|nr:OadG family protein [Bacteroidales bacterium]